METFGVLTLIFIGCGALFAAIAGQALKKTAPSALPRSPQAR